MTAITNRELRKALRVIDAPEPLPHPGDEFITVTPFEAAVDTLHRVPGLRHYLMNRVYGYPQHSPDTEAYAIDIFGQEAVEVAYHYPFH